MATATKSICKVCGEVFFATLGYIDEIGEMCARCADVSEDEIIETRDKYGSD